MQCCSQSGAPGHLAARGGGGGRDRIYSASDYTELLLTFILSHILPVADASLLSCPLLRRGEQRVALERPGHPGHSPRPGRFVRICKKATQSHSSVETGDRGLSASGTLVLMPGRHASSSSPAPAPWPSWDLTDRCSHTRGGRLQDPPRPAPAGSCAEPLPLGAERGCCAPRARL